VRRPGFVPDAGDVVWLAFDPQAGHEQAGHEQAGHRPALVLSPASYNAKTGLMVCCPLTTRIKGYPFETPLTSQPGSAVLSDQVKNLDWRARRASRKGRVTDQELRLVRAKLRALIG
jgi:mRNA interferase MazF